MNLLLEELWWPTEPTDAACSRSATASDDEVLTYPQYIALLLLSGVRLGIPCSVMHHVFQISGRWELDGAPAVQKTEAKKEGGSPTPHGTRHCPSVRLCEPLEPEDLTASSASSSHSSCSSCSPSSPVRSKFSSSVSPPSTFFQASPQPVYCAHLSRENAPVFIESPSSIPAFHYFFEPPTNETLVQRIQACCSTAAPPSVHRLPLDCLFCLQEQLRPALLQQKNNAASSSRGKKTKAVAAPLVVNTLYTPPVEGERDGPAPPAAPVGRVQTLGAHFQQHQQRHAALLALLEAEGEEKRSASTAPPTPLEPEKMAIPYGGESGEDEEFEEEPAFDLQSESGREACEDAAMQESRHACFLAMAGTPSCPIAVCYCAACQVFGPLTRFEFCQSARGEPLPPQQQYDPNAWVSVDSTTLILSRLLLALHVLQEALPEVLVPLGEASAHGRRCSALVPKGTPAAAPPIPSPNGPRVNSATRSGEKKSRGGTWPSSPYPDAWDVSLWKNEGGASLSSSTPHQLPALRSRFLFMQTPMVFEDPPPTQEEQMMELGTETDEAGGFGTEAGVVEGGPSLDHRQRLTRAFEEAMAGVVTPEAVLPGARWVQMQSAATPHKRGFTPHHAAAAGSVLAAEEGEFHLQLCEPGDLQQADCGIVEVLLHEQESREEEEEEEEEEGLTEEQLASQQIARQMFFSRSLVQLRDVVSGFLVEFESSEALRSCLANYFIPQLHAEQQQHHGDASAEQRYYTLPHCLSYRDVYHSEHEKWVEGLVLHHGWYAYQPPTPADSATPTRHNSHRRMSSSTKASSGSLMSSSLRQSLSEVLPEEAEGAPQNERVKGVPEAERKEDVEALMRLVKLSMEVFSHRHSALPYRLNGGKPARLQGTEIKSTLLSDVPFQDVGNVAVRPAPGRASRWLGETSDSFRRAFASYTLLFPPHAESCREFLPASLLPKDESTAKAHPQHQSPPTPSFFGGSTTPLPRRESGSSQETAAAAECKEGREEEEASEEGAAASPTAVVSHPLSVDGRRLEFLLGVTALAKVMGELMPRLQQEREKEARERREE